MPPTQPKGRSRKRQAGLLGLLVVLAAAAGLLLQPAPQLLQTFPNQQAQLAVINSVNPEPATTPVAVGELKVESLKSDTIGITVSPTETIKLDFPQTSEVLSSTVKIGTTADGGQAIISTDGINVSGRIEDKGRVYILENNPAGEGVVVSQVDVSTFAEDIHAPIPANVQRAPLPSVSVQSQAVINNVLGVPDNEILDEVIFYTPAVRNAAGGDAAARQIAAQAVADFNAAQAESGDPGRVFLVAALPLTECADSADLSAVLDCFGSSQALANARNDPALKSALYHLIVEGDPTKSCGISYMMGDGLVGQQFEGLETQVTVRKCTLANHSFNHETLHGLGMCHNKAACVQPTAFTFAYGLCLPAACDVMSYPPNGQQRLRRTTGPVPWNGQPFVTAESNAFEVLKITVPVVNSFHNPSHAVASVPVKPCIQSTTQHCVYLPVAAR